MEPTPAGAETLDEEKVRNTIRSSISPDGRTLKFSNELVELTNFAGEAGQMNILNEVFEEENKKDGLMEKVEFVNAGGKGLFFFPDLGKKQFSSIDVSDNFIEEFQFSGAVMYDIECNGNDGLSQEEVHKNCPSISSIAENGKRSSTTPEATLVACYTL